MRIDLVLPKEWKEVQGKHLVKLARIFLKYQEKPEFLTQCFLLFSGWKILNRREFIEDNKTQYWFKSGNWKFYINSDLFHSLVTSISFISDKIELPAGNPPIKGYKACNYKLYNVTLEEYLEADNFYNAFVSTKQYKYLGKMVAVLYKKKSHLVFHRISRAEKYAVFIWFSGVKSLFVHKYPYLFTGGSGSASVESPEESILNLLSALNDGKPHDNERIFKTHVHECFHELNLKIENAETKK